MGVTLDIPLIRMEETSNLRGHEKDIRGMKLPLEYMQVHWGQRDHQEEEDLHLEDRITSFWRTIDRLLKKGEVGIPGNTEAV